MRIVACWCVLGIVGCSASHPVDDAGAPDAPVDVAPRSDPRPGAPCLVEATLVFDEREVYVEIGREACGATEPGSEPTVACMVYRLSGDPAPDCTESCADPAETARRIFCTCRCDAPLSTSPTCTCPADMSCVEVLELGPDHLRGSYCVRTDLAP